MLDLFNMQTLAEEIAADPAGPQVRRLAKQIIENCEMQDVVGVRELAEQIRTSSAPDERCELAQSIIVNLGAMLKARDAEMNQTTVPFSVAG